MATTLNLTPKLPKSPKGGKKGQHTDFNFGANVARKGGGKRRRGRKGGGS